MVTTASWNRTYAPQTTLKSSCGVYCHDTCAIATRNDALQYEVRRCNTEIKHAIAAITPVDEIPTPNGPESLPESLEYVCDGSLGNDAVDERIHDRTRVQSITS